MRLDMFLKISRIVPRRTQAKKMCDDERIMVNDRPAKSAHEVHAGDIVLADFPGFRRRYRVEAVPDSRSVSRQAARDLVTLLDTQRKDLLE
jgi:ribosomal 50S subunit-recycling heat shock protein